MRMYCIYERPSDFPDQFVVRMWGTLGGKPVPARDPYALATTLEEARAALPNGLSLIPRFENDDPVIVEVWV